MEWARGAEQAPSGWPAALVMFHLAMWRERMRVALIDVSQGRPPTQPGEADEINDEELPAGIGTPLADAAARSDHLLAEITNLYRTLGDREFHWYRARTTSEAILGNSYTHPRTHLHAYWRENGDPERANKLYEDAVAELRQIGATEVPMGAALYNLACARALDGRRDEAVELIKETVRLRPDLRTMLESDDDLAMLRGDPEFRQLAQG